MPDSDSLANAIARDQQRTLANLNKSLDLLTAGLAAQTAALKAVLAAVQSTAGAATAGNASLPSAPVGFLNITLPNGSPAKVPFYNP